MKMPASDSEIINAVLEGDSYSFGELVDRYQARLMRYLINLLGNHHDCEEIVQDSFMQGFRHLNAFDSNKSCFEAWLTTIARRKAFNYKQKKRPSTIAQMNETKDYAPNNQAMEGWREELDTALARLPILQRSAFTLTEIQQMPYEQVSKIEGVPIGTIKSRVSRAKEKLRNILEKPTRNK